MKVAELRKLEAERTFEIGGGKVTKEMIVGLASHTGFQREGHIQGERTILSDLLKEESLAFMCAAGTITILFRSLRTLFYDVWQLSQSDEKFVLRMGEALFLDPNPEGGVLTTFFTVQKTKGAKFAKCPNDSVIVVMDCKILNVRKGVTRKVLTTSLLLQFVEESPKE